MPEPVMNMQKIASHAIEVFTPILDEWRGQPHPDPSVAGAVGNQSSAQLLEQDFRDIGIYIIGNDDRGTRIELGALVDCISALRERSGRGGANISAEELESEFNITRQRNAESSFLPPPAVLTFPLSLRVARDLQRMGMMVDARAIKDLLVEFAHRIVIQDGNVTAEEIAIATEIEDFLTDMINNAA